MNFLNIRKGPPMEFVIGEHRNSFEQHVINLYMEAEGGFWDCIPSFDANILANIKPSYVFAGLLGEATGDPSYFVKETAGKVIPELREHWSNVNLNKISEEHPEVVLGAMARIGEDALSVVDYHHMHCAIGLAPGPGTGYQGFMNVPIVDVW